MAQGGPCSGGYSLSLKDSRLCYVHNHRGLEEHSLVSDTPLSPGPQQVEVEFSISDGRGTATLRVDGHDIGGGEITAAIDARYSTRDEGLCCGYDGGGVTSAYRTPFPFSGTVAQVVVEVADATVGAQ